MGVLSRQAVMAGVYQDRRLCEAGPVTAGSQSCCIREQSYTTPASVEKGHCWISSATEDGFLTGTTKNPVLILSVCKTLLRREKEILQSDKQKQLGKWLS